MACFFQKVIVAFLYVTVEANWLKAFLPDSRRQDFYLAINEFTPPIPRIQSSTRLQLPFALA